MRGADHRVRTEVARLRQATSRTRTVLPLSAAASPVEDRSSKGESSLKEIERQQWNFSPPESTREVEEYRVELSNVTILELIIKPNIGGGPERASLKSLRLS